MSKDSFKVFWEQEAARDLEELVLFISNDGVATAQKWFAKIKSKAKSLKSNPHRARIVPELINATQFEYRELLIGHYRLIFVIKAKQVFVMALIDGRRDLDQILMQRVLRNIE